MSSLSLKPHASIASGNRFWSQAGLSSHYRNTPKRRARFSSSGTIRSVASDLAKVNSRANHIKVDKLESSTNGAVKSLIASAEHLDAAVSAIDVALLSQKLQKEEAYKETKEIPLDVLGRGRLVENKLVYRQVFVIRSYEVGFDKTAPIETITNLFQETALNHVGMMDFVGDGMGTTHAMMKDRLIWIVTRMHIEMTRYPVWGDVVQIDSWVSSSGKNGMRRDFLVRDYRSGLILARATSNWAMMNQDTRRLSKMPDAVRAEISPSFIDRSVMDEEESSCKRIAMLDDSAPFRITGLAPKLHDLDMNQHVNHVKYIDWLLESVPQPLLVSYELMTVTLEYRRECGSSDTVESLARPDSIAMETTSDTIATEEPALQFTHLLRLQGGGGEVLRGRTQWRPKKR